VAHTEERRCRGVPPRLLDDAVPRIDEDERELGRRCPGHHVAGVFHVPRGVGEDERATRRREVAIGDVDGDALLALGAEAVGEQCEVDRLVPLGGARPLDRGEGVGEDRLGVVQKSPDEGGLAVVDGARGGEPQELVRGRRRGVLHDGGHV